MSQNGNSQIFGDEETEVMSQNFDVVYTGQSCSELDDSNLFSKDKVEAEEREGTQATSQIEDIILLRGQPSSVTGGIKVSSQDEENENTEPMSQGSQVVYTGQTCSPHDDGNSPEVKKFVARLVEEEPTVEESFDPDATYVDESLLLPKHIQKTGQLASNTGENSKEDKLVDLEQTDTGSSLSQEFTPPQLQPETNLSSNSCLDTTQVLTQEMNQSPTTISDAVGGQRVFPSQSSSELLETKASDLCQGLSQEDRSSLATYSSSSSSQIVSSSSSSKRPTDSDDTDEMVGSQDMFASQGSSQKSVLTTSQFMPTLQLSGEIQSSQGYEGFVPDRLPFTSPTCQTTSTPLSKVTKSHSNNLSGDVIALSDEEDVQKVNEKRKHSDSSDDSRSVDNKFKRPCVDNRQSVVFLQEFNSPQRQPSSGSPDLSHGSQCFNLYLSQVETDETGSQNTISPSPPSNSVKSQTESQVTVSPNMNYSKTSSHNTSVVQIDDMDDEIQLVSPVTKSNSLGEIQIMDFSETKQGMSTSGDIQVLTPVQKKSLPDLKLSLVEDSESSKFIKNGNTNSLSSNSNLVNVASPIESPSKGLELKEHKPSNEDNEQNIQEFSNKMIMTFTCTYSVSCHTTIDMNKKKTVSNSISSFEVLESKTIEKRDSSPSAVEESSPGRGGSPGSVASGPGPFRLQPSHATRFSMMSTTSSSSAGSYQYHQASARRGRAAVPQWRGGESSTKGPVPWQELLQQYQDELARSGAPLLEKWGSSPIVNSSSDEGKTVHEEKGLETVPEDDGEEVLGVPASNSIKILQNPKRALRNVSSSTTVQRDPENESLVKTECETPTSKRKRGRPPKAATPSRTPSGSTKKRTATPNKKKGSEETSSIPEESSMSSGSYHFATGTPVFALWNAKDKAGRRCYYPGHIESATRANQWTIAFLDGLKNVSSKNDILIINTFEIGQSLLVKNKSGEYCEGKVSEVTPLKGGEDLFTIELLSSSDSLGNMTVPISELALTEDQAKLWMHERPASSQSSSSPTKRLSASKMSSSEQEILKNLDLLHDLPGRRVRTPKGSQATVSSPARAGPSNTSRRLIADSGGSSTADEEPLATLLAKEKVGPYSQVVGVELEQRGFASADPLARKGKGIKNSSSKKPLPDIDNDEIVQQLGPIPPDGSKIFSGFTFILTKTDMKPKDRREPVTDSEVTATDGEDQQGSDVSLQYPSDSECYKFTRCPMVKDRLARQITQGGGKVLKLWTDILTKDINSTFVVSDRPCLTPIYLHCLARGVKSINHDYIIDCCKQNTKFSSNFKNNFLPVGYSHSKQDFVLWRDHKSKSPLSRENILVVGEEDKTFKAFWEELLRLTGAKISSSKTCRGMTTVTKIISDNPCSETILARAEELNIPVLSPVWITQSLIENQSLSVAKLPSFSHDYVESE
ncbi:uncharacterized protein LOC113213821 isoform X1 [Frankliniella occidentalis]|uniref:Uncharacterized protein LOC113213821 isoform X1 n=1 Tax=Frankliniella occidentalis TaxID=133901 RepID=A0A6J1T5C9_FRAOC|nr:uncharacterized protein LOC113213821 isoform X1 [Frankliniella occidentalis]